jgi:hypothetical protein
MTHPKSFQVLQVYFVPVVVVDWVAAFLARDYISKVFIVLLSK